MRILRLLLISLIIAAILGGGGFLVVREVLLTKAVFDLENAAVELVKPAIRQKMWQQCKPFSLPEAQIFEVKSVEVAFINDRQYQLQVICDQYQSQPVVMRTYTLPSMVTKQAGTAGLVASEDLPSSVTVQLWGRYRTVTLENQKVRSYFGQAPLTSVLSPTTSCSGYGYQCCQASSELGKGQLAPGVIDCPQTCYSSCSVRPVVLSFNTQPFFELPDRSLTITSGETVTFSYVVESNGMPLRDVTIIFGDGQKEVLSSESDSLTHTYVCQQSECQYLAKVIATDRDAVTSPNNSISEVKIKVSSQR